MATTGSRWIALLACAVVAILSPGCAPRTDTLRGGSGMDKLTGTISYRERIALPPEAIVSVRLEDISLQDAPATVLTEITLRPQAQLPIPFQLEYDPDQLDDRRTYGVRADIRRDGNLLFVTDTVAPVLTRGHGKHVDLVLVRSGGGAPVADAELAGTRWMLRTLGGKEIRASKGGTHPFLQFDGTPPDLAAFGQGGCNTFRGKATVSETSLKLGPLATTKMACPDMELESRFYRALDAASGWRIGGTWLVLSGPDGEVATFEAYYE